VDSGASAAQRMGVNVSATVLSSPDAEAWGAIRSAPERSPLLEAPVVKFPNYEAVNSLEKKDMDTYAVGLIETQGFTAVFEAIDAACKAANVQIVGKEKLGGGYVTVIIKGDVAAVTAAVEAGRSRVEGLGKLIAAHVIARPSEAVLSLVPKAG